MRSSPQTPERSLCPVCRAEISADETFCAACGTNVVETPTQSIRSLSYLLAELSRWEEEGIVGQEQARALRVSYERKLEDLRAQLAARSRERVASSSTT